MIRGGKALRFTPTRNDGLGSSDVDEVIDLRIMSTRAVQVVELFPIPEIADWLLHTPLFALQRVSRLDVLHRKRVPWVGKVLLAELDVEIALSSGSILKPSFLG